MSALIRDRGRLRAAGQALLVTFLWSTSWVLIKFGLKDIPAEGQEQGHGVLGGGSRVATRHIHDEHPPTGGGPNIDVVQPRTCSTHHLETRRPVEYLLVHGGLAADDECVAVGQQVSGRAVKEGLTQIQPNVRIIVQEMQTSI